MEEEKEQAGDQQAGWLERPGSIKKLFVALAVFSLVLILADLAYHKHVHYAIEEWFGFYALFGFLAYSLIVGAGWLWRRVVMRKEDYYDG
jgi:hypothetical protein